MAPRSVRIPVHYATLRVVNSAVLTSIDSGCLKTTEDIAFTGTDYLCCYIEKSYIVRITSTENNFLARGNTTLSVFLVAAAMLFS